MQMSVSHSVPKYMLIMYYEILIIREEKKESVCQFWSYMAQILFFKWQNTSY